MFTIDAYLRKKFHITNYNCWHFVRDVWQELTGTTLYDFTPAHTSKAELELAAHDAVQHFVQVERGPGCGPLIVLMQQTKTAPHVGVLIKGKVLHLKPCGAAYEAFDVARIGFSKVSFYTCKPSSWSPIPST